MALFQTRTGGAVAMAAALSMVAMPASAASLPRMAHQTVTIPAATPWSVDQETVQHRRWGGYGGGYGGWGGGYRGWGRHRDNDVDAGDVLAGVIILGGIAAIASAASNKDRERRTETDPNGYPYRNDRNRDWQYRYRENAGRDYQPGSSDRGLDNAADQCVREVERTERVDEVNSVDRGVQGWRVEGKLANGRNFSCDIGNDGRIGPVDLGGSRVGAVDGQWDDDAYARARAEHEDRGPDA